MALYVIDRAVVPTADPTITSNEYPHAYVQTLMFTSESGTELTGKTVSTAHNGLVTCAPGSMAYNAAMTLVKQFDGTDSPAGWVTVKDTREA